MTAQADTPRVIIVGGGFGGYYAARGLHRHGVQTTLIDSNGFQTFQPMLYQAATGIVRPADVEYDLDQLKGVEVLTRRASAVDCTRRTVTLDDGTDLSADFLLLSTGASVNYFGVDGAAEHAYPLYTAADAQAIKKRLQALVESQQSFRIVVIGAGATGVEITGAMSDALDGLLPRTYPNFRRENVELDLVDHGTEPLAHMTKTSQEFTTRTLAKAGVKFHWGAEVTAVTDTSITLSDGTSVGSDLTIWAGGLSVNLPDITPAPAKGRGGRIVVDSDLRINGMEKVYCIGDASADSKAPLPQLGAVAKQQGIHAASNIHRQIRGKAVEDFAYRDLGQMAMIRHDAAVVEMPGHHKPIDGTMAYVMWLGVHADLLPGGDHRIDAVRGWIYEQASGKSKFLQD